MVPLGVVLYEHKHFLREAITPSPGLKTFCGSCTHCSGKWPCSYGAGVMEPIEHATM